MGHSKQPLHILWIALAALPAHAQTPVTETVVHNFGLPPLSGAHPYGSLLADPSGNLYGTASQGGKAGAGVVFKIDSAGQQSVLYSFTGGADGKTPNAGVVRDPQGNLYGTTAYGGTSNAGVVYKLSPTGAQTVLHTFTGGADGGNPDAPLVLDPGGNLYGTTTNGGSAGLGAVFKISRTGAQTVLYSFQGGNDGAHPYAGLTLDSSGNLYGTTINGGPANAGVVYKLVSGTHETVLYTFMFGSDGAYPYAGVILDSAGNLYGTATEAVQAEGVVYKLTPAGQQTVLYSFNGESGSYPLGSIVLDANGNLYGTTSKGGSGSGVVYELNAAGTEAVLHRFAGPDGSYPYGGLTLNAAGHLCGTTSQGGTDSEGAVFTMDAAGTEAVLFNFPGPGDGTQPDAGVTLDAAGNLYGTTVDGGPAGHGVVYRVSTSGQETILYSFTGGADGSSPSSAVVLDSAGNIYGTTLEGGTNNDGAVYKVDPAGNETVLHTFDYTDGSGPNGLISDSAGNLYGATFVGGPSYGGVVFKLTTSGTYTMLYGFGTGANSGPVGNLARDTAGNLYGNTEGNSGGLGVVFKLDTSGHETVLYNFATGSGGNDPYQGVVLDPAGNLYGTTYQGGTANDGVVYKVTAAGHYSVLHSFTGGSDGLRPVAAVTLDSSGNIYGTTEQGGTSGEGVVFMIGSSGTESVLYSFTGASGANPACAPARDSSGDIYGTAAAGGTSGGGVVFKLTPE
jgi:uncharacterized repeat protein (TIGR03803 family)